MEVINFAILGLLVTIGLATVAYLMKVNGHLNHMNGSYVTHTQACDKRFTRLEIDVRQSQNKSSLEGDLKITDDLIEEKRLARMEYDIKILQQKLKLSKEANGSI